MATKAELIKKLRTTTQAGMMDCQKALIENNNDFDLAVQWLREKGITKAIKKAGAIAAEGVTKAIVEKNKAIIIEVNSQTDFVATNEKFIKLVDEMVNVIKKEAKADKDIAGLKVNGKLITEAGMDLTATIGEKIAFRRANILTATAKQTISSYTHANNRVSSIVLIEGKVDAEVAKNVCMHIAAMSPKYLGEKDVDPTWLANEKKVLIEQTIAEGKDAKFADKIVIGRVNKLLKEICLVNQKYVKDSSLTVEQYVKNAGGVIIAMYRYEVGEGIERKCENFADEVAAQMAKK